MPLNKKCCFAMQIQFNDCVSHLQDRHKKRIEHYRHIIEVLHAELQSKGSLRNEVIQVG